MPVLLPVCRASGGNRDKCMIHAHPACISTSKIRRPKGCDRPVSFTGPTKGWGSCKAEPTSGDPSEIKFTSVRWRIALGYTLRCSWNLRYLWKRESPTRNLMMAQDLLVILPPSCEEISQNKSARHRADNANLIRRKKYNPPVPLTSISYPRHLFFGFLFLFAASTGANSYWIFIRSPSCEHQFQMAWKSNIPAIKLDLHPLPGSPSCFLYLII